MAETEIQKLFAYQYGLLNNNLVLPNITMGSPGARYEADLIYINKRRYVAEVEIKINMSDFKADFKKKVYHNSDIVRQFYYLFPNDLYIENSQEIERLPWADKYWENGKVPDEAFLAHGWSVSCYKCGKMVDIDTVVLIDTRGALCKECAGKDGK